LGRSVFKAIRHWVVWHSGNNAEFSIPLFGILSFGIPLFGILT
jgi:hypothetical protein